MKARHGERSLVLSARRVSSPPNPPPPPPTQVLEWRSREALLVKHGKYSEAARIKAMANELELRDRTRVDEERLQTFSQREIKFRTHQRAELEALLSRFNSRRDDHVKQRDIDVRRLLQRNKNVLGIIDLRHSHEEREARQSIRVSLMAPISSFKPASIDMGKKPKGGVPSATEAADRRALQVVKATNLFSPPIKAIAPRKRDS